MGIDTDPALLARLGVEARDGVRFDEVVGLLGQAKFAPVIHRPLFRHLGFVTNRTFETFYADSLPVLLLPRDFVAAIYGEAALTLVPGEDIAAHLDDALSRPEIYWEAVLQTRRASGARTIPTPGGFEELGAFTAARARSGRRAVNVLVVMKHRGNAGNTHAVANYMRLAPKHGHSVAIFGTPIWYVPELQFSTDIRSFDRVVYVYEFGALPHRSDAARPSSSPDFRRAAPADHGHGRHVQSRGHDRWLRLQSCERGRAGALDRSPRCARRQGHADHHGHAHPSRARRP